MGGEEGLELGDDFGVARRRGCWFRGGLPGSRRVRIRLAVVGGVPGFPLDEAVAVGADGAAEAVAAGVAVVGVVADGGAAGS